MSSPSPSMILMAVRHAYYCLLAQALDAGFEKTMTARPSDLVLPPRLRFGGSFARTSLL